MKKLLTTLLFILVGVSVSQSGYITQINKKSSSENIIKLQNIFKELNLYSGNVNGNYNDIKNDLINYQVKNNIISNANSSQAGYFGNKTIKSLRKNYGNQFEELNKKYLKIPNPKIGEKIEFTATAYYTPIRGQKKYYRGTYKGDVKLQGNGRTAVGKKASIGSLSAPKTFSFGTKIYLEGIGVGEVQDRGGSIYGNRIDIWMGEGDIGRERAIKRGRRKINGYIVEEEKSIDMEFSNNGFFIEKTLDSLNETNDNKNIEENNKKQYTQEITNKDSKKYKLSKKKKNAIQKARNLIVRILRKETNSISEFDIKINELKTNLEKRKLKLNLRKQSIVNYLINIL